MRSHVFFTVAAAFCLTSGATNAAPLLSVSYEVVGGSFDGLFSSGPIVSGKVTFTPIVPTSTPFSTYKLGNWNLALSGPSGSFRATFVKSALVVTPAYGFLIYTYGGVPTHGPALSNGNLLLQGAVSGFTFAAPQGVGGVLNVVRLGTRPGGPCPDCGAPLGHMIEVGNEVRTFVVPEPATGALLGLGLVLMGFAGGSGAVAARARRDRRS
jgi:hypothetical protein